MKKLSYLLLMPAIILTACAGGEATSSTPTSSSESISSSETLMSSSSSVESSSSVLEGEGYYQAEDTKISLDERPDLGVFAPMNFDYPCPSVGQSDLLVIPLTFSDDSTYTQENLDDIEEVYLSENLEENAFYSLKKYYELSSYGKLSFDIHIVSPYMTSLTADEFQDMYDLNEADLANPDPVQTVIEDYLATCDEEFIASLDSNNDGYIDAIHLIYLTSKKVITSISLPWWSYTSYISSPNEVGTKKAGIYTFSSFTHIVNDNEGYGEYPDSHTIIHETGHVLGLDDYYNVTSYDIGSPAGYLDMMDGNTGDHAAYSKMLLGWIDPIVIDHTATSFEITLRPFESSGDVILLKPFSNDWNGSAFDEYITLSYYTTTGINYPDSEGYPGYYNYGYNHQASQYKVNGVQAYHVDSRMILDDGDGRYHYMSDPDLGVDNFYAVAGSNSAGYGYDINSFNGISASAFRLIEAISADGTNYFNTYSRTMANFGNPNVLFAEGDKLSDSTAPATFNDGSSMDYDFEIVSLSAESVIIRFELI